ncbi:hypothetical protein Despr_0268 [Desulfobulbus propionicus DSM 2032]|uniref:Uncharacterized protein n=1 Tax=Desulfobulbus propionicus (strain ATCC 33891 / DSM 2032 / VKM B-1956 / 1pr3) TaxID=577650 RepID=A0A7U3YJC4_DESPD|nr:hypothetical protein Despr_0268 [Desulfobulbus propionicus DSM 2032]
MLPCGDESLNTAEIDGLPVENLCEQQGKTYPAAWKMLLDSIRHPPQITGHVLNWRIVLFRQMYNFKHDRFFQFSLNLCKFRHCF